MTEREQGTNQNAERWLPPGEMALVVLGIIAALSLVASHYYEWIGLRGKTLWDWADLLIVPVVIAVVGYLFTRSENRNAQALADQRAQDTMLQTYLGEMGELLMDRGLRDAESAEPEVRRVARARTLSVFKALGPRGKRDLLQFLWEAELIMGDQPIIRLRSADLSHADLRSMNLFRANLVGVNLRGANLSGASLSVLRGTGETLVRAARLNVDVSTLLEPQSAATLVFADLTGAILRGTNMDGVDLQWANLSRADMTRARVSAHQLDTCESLAGATMPDGSRHP